MCYAKPSTCLFNAHAFRLWARFTMHLRRELAARLAPPGRPPRAVLRISFAKVAEYQKRGLVHFHAEIRLDGPDGSSQPPPAYPTVSVLTDAIRAAATPSLSARCAPPATPGSPNRPAPTSACPIPDPETTLVIGHWAYLGTRYSPGAALLAAVWHRRELARQFIAEGGC